MVRPRCNSTSLAPCFSHLAPGYVLWSGAFSPFIISAHTELGRIYGKSCIYDSGNWRAHEHFVLLETSAATPRALNSVGLFVPGGPFHLSSAAICLHFGIYWRAFRPCAADGRFITLGVRARGTHAWSGYPCTIRTLLEVREMLEEDQLEARVRQAVASGLLRTSPSRGV
jgi:hypothetical protein